VAELLQKQELTMKKRIDPCMHSAEHILNQTMDRLFNCGRCFNAHIEKKKSKCDYRFDRPLSPTEVQEIQTQVNQIIEANLPVTEKYISRSEALANYNTDKLPRDTGDTIRIVQIGDYDACPCIGHHVNSSSEISGFQITSTSFDKDVLRIRFKLIPISDS
jgi:Ser-tRNA(Ala) deacylase AlaX